MARGQYTFLELTNRVLQRLGKSQITDFVNQTGDTWGGLVRDFVNDAQREMEKEHDWSTLMTSGTFTTSDRAYDLSDTFADFGREIDLVNLGTKQILMPVSLRQLDEEDPAQVHAGEPTRYSIQYPWVEFNRSPTDGAFRLRYCRRPAPLVTLTDTSDLPEYCDLALIWWAVWQFQASREDAQDGGERARDIYEKSLARAIGQDRRRMDRIFQLQPIYPGGSGRMAANLGPSYEPV